jgi:hypothetical protein
LYYTTNSFQTVAVWPLNKKSGREARGTGGKQWIRKSVKKIIQVMDGGKEALA